MAENTDEFELIDTIPSEMYDDFVQKATHNGEPFYIVFDKEGLKKELGFSSYTDMESFCDDIFGEWNWGYDDQYITCDFCGEIINLEDYGGDYWIDYEYYGGVCGNCVRTTNRATEAYLEYLTNNPDAVNTLLDTGTLTEYGYTQLEGEYQYGSFGRRESPRHILDNLLAKYPQGEFIFDLVSNRYATQYTVWAKEGYDREVLDDEEE